MALACSHLDFKRRNVYNGKLERHTWSKLMLFTDHDKQNRDWTYYITYKFGKKQKGKEGKKSIQQKNGME
jgi:hypothetical protein